MFTLTAWVRPTAGKPAAGGRAAVVSLCDAARETAATLAWNGTHFSYADATLAAVPVASAPVTPGQWHHVAVSFVVADRGAYFDAGGAARAHRAGVLYVDGVPTPFDTILPPLAGATLTVGAEYGLGALVSTSYFDGDVDEVRLFDRALSAGGSGGGVRALAFAAPTYGAAMVAAAPFAGLKVHFDFEDLPTGTWTGDQTIIDRSNGTTATVVDGEGETIAAMPFAPIAVTGLTRAYAPLDAEFPAGRQVPSTKGGVVTVAGCCFADTSHTTVTVNGVAITGVVVAADGMSMTVPVPALLAPAAAAAAWTAPLEAPLTLTVSNGAAADDAQTATLPLHHRYIIAEDFAADLTRHLEFKGNVNDARDLSDTSLAATVGGGSALSYVEDRNGDPGRAVNLTGAGAVFFGAGLGSASAWTLCAWIKPAASAADTARVAGGSVYSERTLATAVVTAVGTINALGVTAGTGALTFAGSVAEATTTGGGADGPGALAPEAWQFVCAVRRGASTGVELFVASDRAGTVTAAAAPTAAAAAAAPVAVLGGGSFLGALDDLWVLGRALAPAEVARLHGARTLAPRFDGVAGRFSLVSPPTSSATTASAFRSSAWRGGGTEGNLFTVEAWVKPSDVAGLLLPIFHAPASPGSCPLCASTSTTPGYHGVYLGLDDGHAILFMLQDPSAYGNTLALVLATETEDVVVAVGTWTHLAATFNGTHSIMAVNGVPVLVRSTVMCPNSGGGGGFSKFCPVNNVGQRYPLVASDAVATLGSATYIQTSGDVTRFFNGTIGSLRLYTRALAVSEIEALYRCPRAVPAAEADMSVAFDFTSGSGGVEDSLPSGTLTAQARWSGHSEFLGAGAARAVAWEAVALGSGHGMAWSAATVVGQGIDRADAAGESVEATIQARDQCGRPWPGTSPPLRASLVGPLATHTRQIPAHVSARGSTGGVYTVRWSTTARNSVCVVRPTRASLIARATPSSVPSYI